MLDDGHELSKGAGVASAASPPSLSAGRLAYGELRSLLGKLLADAPRQQFAILPCVMAKDRLGIGFVGSGFVTGFHLQALVGVRDADVRV